MAATASSTYHHGDLPAALRAATAELVTERGPTGFSLREVARRAGVSHAAPAHHYGSARGLLTAVAAEGWAHLNEGFAQAEAEAGDDPVEWMRAMGKAYVNNALAHPGHFGVMCNEELVDGDNEELFQLSTTAFESLQRVVGALAEAHNPELDVEAASMLAWSMVHGLVSLHLTFQSTTEEKVPGTLDEMMDRFTVLFVDGIRHS
jgi:AcrR family transcriptional regulator